MNGELAYNSRLFSGRNLRSWLHSSRFNWFGKKVGDLYSRPVSAVELGCFDGRLLDYFPLPPSEYAGFDADWEGGLSSAVARYKDVPGRSFHKASEPNDLAGIPDCTFDISVTMETLEHVPPELVDGFVSELARVTRGHLFASVPNERGAVFLAKYLTKRIVHRNAPEYSPSEIVLAALGRMDSVERNQHKGFDYKAMISTISRHFEIVEVTGLPFWSLPVSMAFTVAILAKKRPELRSWERPTHP